MIDSHEDLPGLLEDLLVVPVRVDAGQLPGQAVVLPQENRVESCQSGLLVIAVVP